MSCRVTDFPLEVIQETLQKRLGPGVQVRRPQARNQAVEKMLRSFHVNLTALSLIALIVGMFLIYNSTTISVVQRRREIGILRALGVPQRHIFRLIMSEALVTGILGAAAGIGMGWLLARLALQLVSPAVSALYVLENVNRVVLTWDTASIGAGLGMSTALLSAAWPTLEALRLSPMGAIQQRGVYSVRQTPCLADDPGWHACCSSPPMACRSCRPWRGCRSLAMWPVWRWCSACRV